MLQPSQSHGKIRFPVASLTHLTGPVSASPTEKGTSDWNLNLRGGKEGRKDGEERERRETGLKERKVGREKRRDRGLDWKASGNRNYKLEPYQQLRK